MSKPSGPTSLSRRSVLTTLAGTTAVAWVAPAVIGTDRVAAASGSLGLQVTGQVTIGTLAAGQSLAADSNQYSSNQTMFVFEENTNVLTSPQVTDSGLTLAAGVTITSYIVHYSRQTGVGNLSGTVTFPGEILGWDWDDEGLLPGGDALWGVPGVDYGDTFGRGLEFPSPTDTISVDPPNCFLDLALRVGSRFVDHLRVYVLG